MRFEANENASVGSVGIWGLEIYNFSYQYIYKTKLY